MDLGDANLAHRATMPTGPMRELPPELTELIRDFAKGAKADTLWTRRMTTVWGILDHFFGKERMAPLDLTRPSKRGAAGPVELLRLMNLAESFVNLSDCYGFEKKLKVVQSQATLAECENEMWAASLIGHVGIPLSFIDAGPQQQTLDVSLGDDVARVEFKAKDQSADFSKADTTIKRSLRAALEKPSPVPRMVFLRLPNEWTKQPFFNLTFQAACQDSLALHPDACLFLSHGETLVDETNRWAGAAVLQASVQNPCFRAWNPVLSDYVARLCKPSIHRVHDWATVDAISEHVLGPWPPG